MLGMPLNKITLAVFASGASHSIRSKWILEFSGAPTPAHGFQHVSGLTSAGPQQDQGNSNHFAHQRSDVIADKKQEVS